jgi:hypothetical protein
VICTLATGEVLPGHLRERLAGAALLAGVDPAAVMPLLTDGPHVSRVATELAGRILLAASAEERRGA